MQSKQMKMKLAAAAVVAAFAAPSHAAIQFGGNGELFWSIFDEAGSRSYVRDLGVTMDAFLQGVAAGTTFEFANDTTLNTFLAETSSDNLPNLVWNIAAFDISGINRVVVTGGTIPTTFTNFDIGRFDDKPIIYTAAVDSNVPGVDNGSFVAVPDDGDAYFAGGSFGSNFGGAASGMVNTVGIGQAATMYLLAQNSTTFASRFLTADIGAITFNGQPVTAFYGDGKLVIQAVPEPSTYVLMGAGLLAVGALARRRRKA